MTKNKPNKKRTSSDKTSDSETEKYKTRLLGALLGSPTKTKAAEVLGISRDTLYRHIEEYELAPLLDKPLEDAMEILAGAAPKAAQGLQDMLKEEEWRARLEAQKEILDRSGIVKPQKGTTININQQFNAHKGRQAKEYEL